MLLSAPPAKYPFYCTIIGRGRFAGAEFSSAEDVSGCHRSKEGASNTSPTLCYHMLCYTTSCAG